MLRIPVVPAPPEKVAAIRAIVYGIHDTDECEHRAAAEEISHLSVPDFWLLLQFFKLVHPANIPYFWRAASRFAAVGYVFGVLFFHFFIVWRPVSTPLSVFDCWIIPLGPGGVLALLGFIVFQSVWRDRVKPRIRRDLFGASVMDWPEDRRALSETLAELRDVHLLPVMMEAATFSGMHTLAAPLIRLLSLVGPSDGELLTPELRRRFYRVLFSIRLHVLWELKVAAFQAAGRIRDPEMLRYARHAAGVKTFLAEILRIRQAAIVYLAAMGQPAEHAGSHRSATLMERGEPRTSRADKFGQAGLVVRVVGAIVVVGLAVEGAIIILLFGTGNHRPSVPPPAAGAAQPMAPVAR